MWMGRSAGYKPYVDRIPNAFIPEGCLRIAQRFNAGTTVRKV